MEARGATEASRRSAEMEMRQSSLVSQTNLEFRMFWKVLKLYNAAVETFLLTTSRCKVIAQTTSHSTAHHRTGGGARRDGGNAAFGGDGDAPVLARQPDQPPRQGEPDPPRAGLALTVLYVTVLYMP